IIAETTVDPPAGVSDLSPVYWLWTQDVGALALPFAVKIPFSRDGQFSSALVYYSEHGAVFRALQDYYTNAGFLEATMPGAGFVIAGAPAEGALCGDGPDDEGLGGGVGIE